MTLVEVLVTLVIASFILLLSGQFISSTSAYQARQEITVPVQESVRGAMEVMATELREAMTPRVISAYSSPPAALSTYASTNTSVSIVSGNVGATFALTKPVGYPLVAGYPTQTALTLDTPNSSGNTCQSILNPGDYFLLLSQPVGGTSLGISWGQVAPVGCVGNNVTSLSSLPAVGQWTLDARALEATITQYSLGTVNGVNVLSRRVLVGTGAGASQVVAFDITGMTVEYSTDGNTFTSTPSSTAEPLAVRITLTGQTNQKRIGVSSTQPYTLSQTVFMRQTALVKNF